MNKCAICNSPNVTNNNPGNDTDIVHKWLCQECTNKANYRNLENK